MAGKVQRANLDTPTARARLRTGRQPHWEPVTVTGLEGPLHLGYRRRKGERVGRWMIRRYIGSTITAKGNNFARYATTTLGRADDAQEANGRDVLSYAQALDQVRGSLTTSSDAAEPKRDPERYTVWDCWLDYATYLESEGKKPDTTRARCHIKPTLGSLMVSQLTTERLRKWKGALATSPAQLRSKNGKPQYRAKPQTEEEIRARRSSANRVLNMLKACLNHAFNESRVTSDIAWRKLTPFEGVETARLRYFTLDEATRLLNACNPDLRPLVRAGLETGARYSELTRLRVEDFNPDVGTLAIHQSKAKKPRHIKLTPEAAEFFKGHCAGRKGLMFTRADGEAWEKNDQVRPMQDAIEQAKIDPPCSFHITRHTWASHAVMNGMPLLLVAKNLGHSDTRMVEKHYGHLAPDWSAQIIQQTAPRYAAPIDKTVTPIR